MTQAAAVVLLLALPEQPAAQPRIAAVEIYGVRKLSKERITRVLGVAAGGALPRSKGDLEEKLESIDGVLRARVEAFCCEGGGAILYVGIEERGAPSFQYKLWPEKEIALPEEVVSAYNDFTAALARASAEGDVSESLQAGHSLMTNLPARAAQERFLGLAELHFDLLRDVLHHAIDAGQRSIAAYVLGYAPSKRAVVDDLQSALQDPAPAVRANAARALKAIAAYEPADPEEKPVIRPTWFVEMLNSVELQDRIEGARAVALFTEKPDEHLFTQLRERAIPSLLEMAAWQHLPHALPAFLVAGRLAGWTEERLATAWTSDSREKAFKEIARTLSAKSKGK